jgi:hypothetical protein
MRTRLIATIVWSLLNFAGVSFGCTCGLPNLSPGNHSMRDRAIAQVNGNRQVQSIFEGSVEHQEIISGPIGSPSSATSMTPSRVHRTDTLRTSRVYRGKNEQHFTVITGLSYGDCGFDFRTGESYLVFATQIEDGQYFTSICTGTNLLEPSGPAVRFLRGEAPSANDLLDESSYYERMGPQSTGSVCGSVLGPNGKPVKDSSVDLTEIREAPYPQNGGGDLSGPDGGSVSKAYLRESTFSQRRNMTLTTRLA